MKDKEARQRLHSLEAHLSCMVVRDCPKCRHLTPQIESLNSIFGGCFFIGSSTPKKEHDYFCLVCGSKLECVTKTVCKVIKEEKGGK